MILELQSGEGGHPDDFVAEVGEVLRDDAAVCQPQQTTALFTLAVDVSDY